MVEAADQAWTDAKSQGTAVVLAVSGPLAWSACRGGRNRCQRGSRATGQTTALNLCAFHKKFGDSARKCVPACSRWGEQRPSELAAAQVFQVEEALDGEDEHVGTAVSSGNV